MNRDNSHITIRLTKEQKLDVRVAAAKEDQDISKYVRRLIKKNLAKK